MSDATVEYRDVAGFPFYRVGSDGSVLSCRSRGGRHVPWRPMTPVRRADGRLMVGLRRDGRLHLRTLHQLVLEAFVGPCPPGLEACHGDGDHLNNRADNLRWDTHVANMADRERHGRAVKGVRSPHAKVNEEAVREIRARCAAGEMQKAIAGEYGVNPSCIQKIVARESWAHVS